MAQKNSAKYSEFTKSVLSVIKTIPQGKVATYKGVAHAMGKPQASRAVGNALNKNENLVAVPCHRVVKSDGTIGGYSAGANKKIFVLKQEGIPVYKNKIKILQKYLYEF